MQYFNNLTPAEKASKQPNLRASCINARATLEDFIRSGCPSEVTTEAANPEWLAMMMCVVGAPEGVSRLAIQTIWKGPGVYKIWVESGPDQSQGWEKLDDTAVVAERIGNLPY